MQQEDWICCCKGKDGHVSTCKDVQLKLAIAASSHVPDLAYYDVELSMNCFKPALEQLEPSPAIEASLKASSQKVRQCHMATSLQIAGTL